MYVSECLLYTTESGVEYYRAGDTGTIVTLADKMCVKWDRTGKTSRRKFATWREVFTLDDVEQAKLT